jgi:murein DD-endopeptidase MepM/ murein hydrolase activator NlpD
MITARMYVLLAVVGQSACGTQPKPNVPEPATCPKPDKAAAAAAARDKVFDTGKPPLPPGLRCLRWPMGSFREASSPFMDPRYDDGPLPPSRHDGTDLPAPIDTDVLAPAGGKVTWTRAVAPCEDAAVTIRFGEGWDYSVHHLSRVDVREGETVVPGQRLGKSGGAVDAPGSGPWTTGPHLHFMLIHEDAYVDAEKYFCP